MVNKKVVTKEIDCRKKVLEVKAKTPLTARFFTSSRFISSIPRLYQFWEKKMNHDEFAKLERLPPVLTTEPYCSVASSLVKVFPLLKNSHLVYIHSKLPLPSPSR